MQTIDRTKPLFAAVANGHFTLPSPLMKMRAGLEALWQHNPPLDADESDEHARLIEATIDAAVSGGPLPSVASLEATRAAARAHADTQSVTMAAADALMNRLNTATAAAADQIITDHLRPKFEAALAAATDACEITARYADDPAAALTAPAKDRGAFVAMVEHVGALDVIYAARRVLTELGARPARDTDGEFASVRNIDELWPNTQRQTNRRPWGNGPEGTRWLIRNGGQLWLPTPAEQDERYDEVYGEAEREARQRQQMVAAVRQGYGGGVPAYATPQTSETGPSGSTPTRAQTYAAALARTPGDSQE